MDELNRRQDNNVHILIVPRGKMACDSRAVGGESTDGEYRTEEHLHRPREKVISAKEHCLHKSDEVLVLRSITCYVCRNVLREIGH